MIRHKIKSALRWFIFLALMHVGLSVAMYSISTAG